MIPKDQELYKWLKYEMIEHAYAVREIVCELVKGSQSYPDYMEEKLSKVLGDHQIIDLLLQQPDSDFIKQVEMEVI